MTSFYGSASASSYWYVDFGFTEHMSQDRASFSTYVDISDQQRSIEGIRGVKLIATGIGDIIIKIYVNDTHTFGILQGVIHIPGLGCNFFSSYVAAKKKLYTLHMHREHLSHPRCRPNCHDGRHPPSYVSLIV